MTNDTSNDEKNNNNKNVVPLDIMDDDDDDVLLADKQRLQNDNEEITTTRTTTSWRCGDADINKSRIRIYNELKHLSKTAIPSMFSAILYRIPWLISLVFVGYIGPKELASAALATTLCNVTGMSLCVGLNSAISTLTGQARGSLKQRQVQQQQRKNKYNKNKLSTSSLSCSSFEEEKKADEEEAEEMTNLINKNNKSASNNNTSSSSSSSYLTFGNNGDQSKNQNQQQENNDEPLLPLVYLYRGIFIQLLFVLPVGIYWLIGIKPLLVNFGQDVELSEMTQQYLRLLTPGLWFYSINYTLTSWLFAIEMADVPAYTGLVGVVMHVPLNLLFVNVLGYGYLGVALATTIFQLVQPLLIITYICYTNHGSNRIYDNTVANVISGFHKQKKKLTLRWNIDVRVAICSLQGIYEYLSLAIPGIIIISEWWASEIIIFLSGTLQPNPEYALAAMTIYQSINSSCFMIPVGISVAASTRVSNLLGGVSSSSSSSSSSSNVSASSSSGSGDRNHDDDDDDDTNNSITSTDDVDLAAKVSVCCAAMASALLGCMLYFTPHTFFPSIFTSDQNVIYETSQLIPLLSLYVFADGIQVCLNGIIKGCGRQLHILPIVVTAYWIIGVPLAYYLSFIRNNGTTICSNDDERHDFSFCGDVGLVTAMTTGTFVHLILLSILVVFTTNWKIEAQKARARLSL